jgi:hypothetical protein
MVERGNVVRDLCDVVPGDAGCLRELEQEQLGERRLSPLDLRGEHGFLADIAVEKEVWVGKEGGDTVQTPEGQQGPLESGLPGPVQNHRAFRRGIQRS